MSVNVNEIIRKLSPAERKKVEARAAELIAEEMNLRPAEARKLRTRPLRDSMFTPFADLADPPVRGFLHAPEQTASPSC